MVGSIMLICCILLIPLWMKKVGPNPIFGYTTKFARSNPKHWYRLNRLSAGLFIPLFGFLAIAELFLNEKEQVWILLGGVLIGALAIRLEEGRLKWLEKRRLTKSKSQNS